MSSQDIGEFPRTYNERVFLEFSSDGHLTFQLKVYRNMCDWGQDWRPTGEGITLAPDHLPQLKELIDQAISFVAAHLPGPCSRSACPALDGDADKQTFNEPMQCPLKKVGFENE